jgi:hypothetical protein
VLDETFGECWIFGDVLQSKPALVKFLYSDGSIGGEALLQGFEYAV